MRLSAMVLLVLIAGCAPGPEEFANLQDMPKADDYCLAAQRVVTKTALPVELVVHKDFNTFVKSKAIINGPNGPQIQQFNWYDDDAALVGVSCKLKNADHLNMTFGPDTAGPDGTCQDMNQAVFRLVGRRVPEPAYKSVSFDPKETVATTSERRGPDWLAPFAITSGEGDTLTIHTKGFIVNFADPAFASRPDRFRGIHYCHIIAPEHLEALLRGDAEPGTTIGRELE